MSSASSASDLGTGNEKRRVGSGTRLPPFEAKHMRARVSALLIVAKSRGTKRVLLTVADNRRSAPAEDGNRNNGQHLAFSAIPA